MLTPYDWQEGIGHRAQYVENRLATGAPVLAVSLAEGVLIYTYRRQTRKIYEIYDRLAFTAIGQQSDVESLRVAAVDFAHQEGYNRSERDVTLQRMVTGLSAPIKRAFADFNSVPVVARSLFAEVGAKPADDEFAILDFDGDFFMQGRFALVAGNAEAEEKLQAALEELNLDDMKTEKALKELDRIWSMAVEEKVEDFRPEAVLLERSDERVNRFRLLTE